MKLSETYPDMFQNSDSGRQPELDDLPSYYSGFNCQFKHKETDEPYFNFFDENFSDDLVKDTAVFSGPPFGLKRSSSDEDIKKKYRELILKCHPDKGGCEKEFIKIQEQNIKNRISR